VWSSRVQGGAEPRASSSATCAIHPAVRARMKKPLASSGAKPRSAKTAAIAPSTLSGSGLPEDASAATIASATATCRPAAPASFASASRRCERGSSVCTRCPKPGSRRPAAFSSVMRAWAAAPALSPAPIRPAPRARSLMQSSTAPPWCRLTARAPAARQALRGAPVVAALRTDSVEGGVTPWSIEATSIASTRPPTAPPGSSPRRIR
jgi:hypothetical protein